MKTLVVEEDMPLVIIFQYLAEGCSCFMIDTGPDSGDEEGGWGTRRREEIVGVRRHDGLDEMGRVVSWLLYEDADLSRQD